MKIYMEPTITRLMELTWGCEDFWDIVLNQHLEDALENYIDEMYPDGVSLGHLNDELRYETADVLKRIGADLTDTIYYN